MMQDEELIRLYVTRSERAIALTSDKYGAKKICAAGTSQQM